MTHLSVHQMAPLDLVVYAGETLARAMLNFFPGDENTMSLKVATICSDLTTGDRQEDKRKQGR